MKILDDDHYFNYQLENEIDDQLGSCELKLQSVVFVHVVKYPQKRYDEYD